MRTVHAFQDDLKQLTSVIEKNVKNFFLKKGKKHQSLFFYFLNFYSNCNKKTGKLICMFIKVKSHIFIIK